MRVLFAVAVIALGIAGINVTSAADIPIDHANNARYSASGHRAAPLVIYDYQPGVVVRAYWRAPWRHRHYYPTTGEKSDIGRDEDMSATGSAPEPAKTFYRSWSNSSAFLHKQPRGRVQPRDAEPAPRSALPPQIPGPLK